MEKLWPNRHVAAQRELRPPIRCGHSEAAFPDRLRVVAKRSSDHVGVNIRTSIDSRYLL